MKKISVLMGALAALSVSAVSAADGWKFNPKTSSADVKSSGIFVSAGCEMFNPSSTVITLRVAGPNGMMSENVEKVTLDAGGRKKTVKMGFISNAEGWKWADEYPDWQGGMFKHLSTASSLAINLMGTNYTIPTAGLSASLQQLKKACN